MGLFLLGQLPVAQGSQQQIALRVDKVPSKIGIADLPSLEVYSLLAALGAARVPPSLDNVRYAPTSRSALSAANARLKRRPLAQPARSMSQRRSGGGCASRGAATQ